MLYNVVVNDWGETTYVPTTLGNVLLAVIILALLGISLFFAKKHSRKLSVKQLVFCAMSIALGTILSNIKLFHFPTGGSITLLSMLVVCLPGYWFGLGVGLLTGVAYGILQMLIDPYILYPAQLVVDYLLAFGALGLSGLFSKPDTKTKNALVKAYLLAVVGRYAFAVLSGWIFFGSYAWDGWGALPYSLAYNGAYIFAAGIITILVLQIPAVRKGFATVKNQALGR